MSKARIVIPEFFGDCDLCPGPGDYIPRALADKMAEALRFYANDDNYWVNAIYGECSGCNVCGDKGEKAEDALEAFEAATARANPLRLNDNVD